MFNQCYLDYVEQDAYHSDEEKDDARFKFLTRRRGIKSFNTTYKQGRQRPLKPVY